MHETSCIPCRKGPNTSFSSSVTLLFSQRLHCPSARVRLSHCERQLSPCAAQNSLVLSYCNSLLQWASCHPLHLPTLPVSPLWRVNSSNLCREFELTFTFCWISTRGENTVTHMHLLSTACPRLCWNGRMCASVCACVCTSAVTALEL